MSASSERLGSNGDRSIDMIGKHLLITGGSGFIGSHMCARLDALGIRYTILDLHAPSEALHPVRWVRGDVRDASAVADAMKGCDAVLHLAAAHHDDGIAHETYFDVNVGSTRLLVEEMVKQGLRRICFFSSAAIYGAGNTPRDESYPPAPTGPYGASKWEAEGVLRAAADAGAVDAFIVRPSVTFGPNNFANMYSLIQQIDAGRYLHVGEGTNVKSLSYVENLVDFTLWGWPRHASRHDAFNWVEAPDLSSAQIANALASALGKRIPSIRLTLPLALALAVPVELLGSLLGRSVPLTRMRIRKLAVEQTQFSSAKARAAGFTPTVALDEALRRTVAWYRAGGRSEERVRRIPPARVMTAGAR